MAIFAMFALAFVAAQTIVTLHASEFGDERHDHDGAPCVVSTLSKGGEKLLAPVLVSFAAVIVTWRIDADVVRTDDTPVALRAAHPRGPPNQ